MGYGYDVELIQIYAWGLLGLLCCCAGLSALLIAWRGRTAGMLLGGVVLGGGLAVLIGMTVLVPRYWWLSVPPICLGVQSLRMWRRPQPAPSMSITLRTAALLVAGIALMLGGYTQVSRHVARETETAQQLESLGADVVRAFDGVVKIVLLRGLSDERVRMAGPLLQQLSSLRELGLEGSRVRSQTLDFLPGLGGLESLGLQGCASVGDGALAHVSQLTDLRQLDLMRTSVGDAELLRLRTLERAERIYLQGSRVTPAGAQRLQAALPEAEISY